MRSIGIRSNTNWVADYVRCHCRGLTSRPFVVFVVLLLCVTGVRPGWALDVFTLWRQPEIPLSIVPGSWVEYRTQTLAGGKRRTGITRIVCLDLEHGSDKNSWLLELLPLTVEDGQTHPVKGEGTQVRVSHKLLERQGTFIEAIVEVVQWHNGKSERIPAADLRRDPLVEATLAGDFVPDKVERKGATTRVVQGRQFVCGQFVMSAADTQTAMLPAGKMIQITSREIVAAVAKEVPFLGLAFVTERVRSFSELDPPSRRFRPPPPQVRVEVMELVAFGWDSRPTLGISD